MKRKFLAIFIALVVSFSLGIPAFAQVPEPPHQFWGAVTIGGGAALDDTVVSASIDGVAITWSTTTTDGKYGYSPLFKIPSDDPATEEKDGGSNGDLIVFRVGEEIAGQATFDSGEKTELPLSVAGLPSPVAEFSASPLSGDEPLTVEFTDGSQNMTNNPVWAWDFGDGGTSTEQNPTHQYLEDGSYMVTLTVTTDEGTDDEVEVDYIVVGDTEPEASFSAEPTSGDYPLEVSFTDSSTSYDGITYEWDFGDGGTSTEPNPTYTYEDEGTYTVALTVTEADEDSDMTEAEDLITVTAPSEPSPSGAYTPPPAPTIDTDLFGTEASFETNSDGEIQETIVATSEDGMLSITIPEGTIALLEGEPLETLTAAVDESPPDPPEDAHVIGLAYDFGPDGATFAPPLTLAYSYDPDALPEDVAEEDLVLAYYDEAIGEWVELDCVVDTENNIITASVAHFTAFAIIGTVTAPEEEVPPEEEEVVPPEDEEVVPPEEEEEVPPVEEEEEVPPVLPVEEEGPPVEIEVVEEEEEEVPPVDEEPVDEEPVDEEPVLEEPVDEELVLEEEEEVPTKPGTNWPLISGIIGGVIVVGLFIYFLVLRRRASPGR